AEDGIRDFHVTGVQTCALPIFPGQVPRTVTSAMEPRVATPVEALRIVTSVAEPRAATRAAARRRATSVAESRAATRAAVRRTVKIGRAPCRERGEAAVGAGAWE